MMAQVVRPLRQWPITPQQCCSGATLLHLLFSPFFAIKTSTSSPRLSFASLPFCHRNVNFRSYGLRLPEGSVQSDLQESNSDSENSTKSRNEKKREARRAFRWGIELATFSTPQIKRILRVASLEQEAFDALMLVKRLGPDVREGKRRQFNYIGRLLRRVQPELMDALIQASKDGDQSKLQALSGTETWAIGEAEEEGEETDYEEEEEEGGHDYIDIASRWFDGLVDKDSEITSEVYSVHIVEFDRQELRKLVRRIHSLQERQLIEENNGEVDAALAGAKKSLVRFLRALAKQMPIE